MPITEHGGRPMVFARSRPACPTTRGSSRSRGEWSRPRDGSRVETALREAWEEIRLPAEAVEVLGLLDDTETRATPFVITPVVGIVTGPVRV